MATKPTVDRARLSHDRARSTLYNTLPVSSRYNVSIEGDVDYRAVLHFGPVETKADFVDMLYSTPMTRWLKEASLVLGQTLKVYVYPSSDVTYRGRPTKATWNRIGGPVLIEARGMYLVTTVTYVPGTLRDTFKMPAKAAAKTDAKRRLGIRAA